MRASAIVFALMLLPMLHSACEGEITMPLPAVTEGEGTLVEITIELIPGEGDSYVGTEPPVGTDTQASLADAIDVASELAGTGGQCDFLMRVEGGNTNGVDGPSGGAAFTVMAYSILTGIPIREDATITGRIGPSGSVQGVGGVYEKALAAKKLGFDYFIAPPLSVEERMMADIITGITIYQASTAEEAIAFFANGTVPEQPPLELILPPLANLTPYTGQRVAGFTWVMHNMIGRERAAIAEIRDPEVRSYFGQKMGQHENLSRLGYDYSAANGAFLTYISASAFSQVTEPDVDGRVEEVEECLASLEKPNLTTRNYEWIMGGEAREHRARQNLRRYIELDAETLEERYLLVYQLGYSVAWCEAARDMYSVARGEGGEPMGASVFKPYAEELLNSTEDAGDWAEYMENAMELYDQGFYAGAAYEITYVSSMLEADEDLVEGVEAERFGELLSGESVSIWGRVFRAQASYLNQSDEPIDGYRIAVFADNMDSFVESFGIPEGEERPAPMPAPEGPAPPEGETQPESPLCLFPFLALLALFIKSIGQY